jgi:hypothetical protein
VESKEVEAGSDVIAGGRYIWALTAEPTEIGVHVVPVETQTYILQAFSLGQLVGEWTLDECPIYLLASTA